MSSSAVPYIGRKISSEITATPSFFLIKSFGSHQRFSEMFRCHWVIEVWCLTPSCAMKVSCTPSTHRTFENIYVNSPKFFRWRRICLTQNCFSSGVFMCWVMCLFCFWLQPEGLRNLISRWCLLGSERNAFHAAAADPCCSSQCAETPAERCICRWSTAGRLSVLPLYRGGVCDVVWCVSRPLEHESKMKST